MSAAAVRPAVVIVLQISSEEKQHMTIIYSRTAQLQLYSSGGFTAVRIREVGVYLGENNSYVNLQKGGFLSCCRLSDWEARNV